MSDLQPFDKPFHQPFGADPAAGRPTAAAGSSGVQRAHAVAGPAGASALAAARDVLRHAPLSREALRAQLVRFGAAAREFGASAAELAEAIDAALAPALVALPAAAAAELRVHAGWWAAHGYHRAD